MQNLEQLKSSDPAHSVWVSASAGTGKTKVLTDRVLRLLLSGTPPAKILCLTFTNAAASEMMSRINHELKTFAQCSQEALGSKLFALLGRKPLDTEFSLARKLFFIMLDSIEKVQVQTIHAFCQSLLRKFPFEAGIAPGFQVIDETASGEILRKVSKIVFAHHKESEIEETLGFPPNSFMVEDLKESRSAEPECTFVHEDSSIASTHKSSAEMSLEGSLLRFIASNVHDFTITELLHEVVGARIKFKGLIARFKGAEEYKELLRKLMNAEDKTEEEIVAGVVEYATLGLSSGAGLRGSQELHETLGSSLHSPEGSVDFHQLKTQLLTLEGKPRKQLMSKAEAALNPDKLKYLTELQSLIMQADQDIKTLRLIEASGHLFVMASSIIKAYEAHKKELGLLDYDDLIYLSQKLLGSSEFKQWVLYKLDGGLEAILVDEAQDTSERQWQIIEALMQEFYAGLDDKARSVFVVGDEKQSIYSFQGASLGAYTGMSKYLMDQMRAAEKPYHIVDLAWSYRSTNAVLDVVNSTFNCNNIPPSAVRSQESCSNPETLGSSPREKLEDQFPQIHPPKVFRNSHPGRVELWPIIKQEAKPEVFWPVFEKDLDEQSAGEKLARAVALFIKQELEAGKIVPSTGKPVALQDFMILLRRRGRLAGQLIKALHDKGLDSGGIDRLALSESLAVLDLLSLAKFVLQPLDDLNLACLLKSPFVGMSEEGLRNLINPSDTAKPKVSLYKKLEASQYSEISRKLAQFRALHSTKSMSDFFHIIVDGLECRQQLLENDGAEGNDAINEFLYRVDSFSKNISSSLQEFVIWFDKNETEIKRDVQTDDRIRIMTVHGSKGLQAPIVILADTTTLPRNNDKILWIDDEIPLWAAVAENKNTYFEKHKEAAEAKEYKEYLRLLYVAMTRAEDRLVITGDSGDKNIPPASWYNVVKGGMEKIESGSENYDFLDEPLLVYATPGSCEAALSDLKEKTILPIPTLPPLVPPYDRINIEGEFAGSSATSQIERLPSPLVSAQGIAYGHIFHKIMEDIVRGQVPYLEQSHPMLELLSARQRDFMSGKIRQLLAMQEFQEILKLDVRTEVSVGLQGEGITIGRIDLMAVGEGKVIIVDYKTDRNPPKGSADVPLKYAEQLKLYRSTIERIYPQHRVETKILWLENLTLMEVY